MTQDSSRYRRVLNRIMYLSQSSQSTHRESKSHKYMLQSDLEDFSEQHYTIVSEHDANADYIY